MFQKLDPAQMAAPQSPFSPGPAPMLTWIPVEKFVVDDTYQREVGRRGRSNVQHIAENFDWSKFAPVIVAPVEGGLYAIVDGQHRTTAAILRGLDQVPCQVVQADRAQQAAAYAAVNGNITKTTPQQLFHARLAAGDKNARELADVCSAGGVEITRRNLILARMTVGQTQAVGALARCLKEYGRDTLITALQCITETSDGNAGFVRATIVEGLCEALNKSEWRDSGEALLRAMDDFSFPDAWGEITDGRDQIFPATVRRLFADKVTLHLAKHTHTRLAKRRNWHLQSARPLPYLLRLTGEADYFSTLSLKFGIVEIAADCSHSHGGIGSLKSSPLAWPRDTGVRNLVANFLRYRRRLCQRVVRDPADIAVRLINR